MYRFIYFVFFLLQSHLVFTQPSYWLKQNSNTNEWIFGVDFINNDFGWAAGSAGTLLKTTDGGTNWILQPTPATATFSSIHLKDPSTYHIVGYNGYGIYMKTTDGGSNWELQTFDRSLTAVHFASQEVGWCISPEGFIFKTTNGGSNWNSQEIPDSTVFFSSLFFINSNTGWVCGQLPATVIKTTDGGESWEVQTNGIEPDEAINNIFFLNEQVGWIVGYYFSDTFSKGVIKKTTDGGNSWFEQVSGTDTYLLSIAFLNQDTGWVVGGGGTILATTNGGENWYKENSGTTLELNKIKALQSSRVWICGENGLILTRKKLINITIKMNPRWNMISLPLYSLEKRRTSIFPTAISQAYKYEIEHGYVAKDSLFAGIGYWIKFPDNQNISLLGYDIDSLSFKLKPGWNLVGGISKTIPLSNIIQKPSNSITAIFGYDNHYRVPDSIEYGKGYWMKALRNCTVTLFSVNNSSISKDYRIDISMLNKGDLPPLPPEESQLEVDDITIPSEYSLLLNYPNPFNHSTIISYALPEPSMVKISIFNLLGQEIAVLENGEVSAGNHAISWNAQNNKDAIILPSSIYFYRLQAISLKSGKNFISTKRMVLIK